VRRPPVAASVNGMDPRTLYERTNTTTTTMADLDLLLAEADREDPYLSVPPREDVTRDADDIDHQILAGLVTP
jgi:hypothetical protein